MLSVKRQQAGHSHPASRLLTFKGKQDRTVLLDNHTQRTAWKSGIGSKEMGGHRRQPENQVWKKTQARNRNVYFLYVLQVIGKALRL